MIKITKTKVNYLENPIGVELPIRFSWILDSDERNVMQEQYRIEIAADPKFQQLVLVQEEESGKSIHIEVKNFEPESLKKYYYRVKVKSNLQETSDYSDMGTFVVAYQSKEQWSGQFISAETKEDANLSKGTYVRKAFELKKPVREAYLSTTALGLYQCFLNEQRVGQDEMTPGWTSYHKHLRYQIYDVTTDLIQGDNILRVSLGAGWYKGTMGFLGLRNNYGAQTAFLGQLHVFYMDGTSEIIETDSTWTGADSPILFSEIYDGEIYDSRKELHLQWHEVSEVVFDKSVLVPQAGCKPAQMTKILAKRIFQTPQGDTVVDFGQNLTGWIHFKVRGQCGDKVEFQCFEVLDSKGNVYLDNLRGAKQGVTYYCKDQEVAEFHPNFTFQGFQYAKVVSYPGQLKVEDIVAYAVHSNMEQTGFFECSNPDLNQLWHNILWGLKGNFLDVPTDCPQRNERVGWTGDAQIFCKTASYLMDTYLFFEKWLMDVRMDQTPEGGVPHVVPDIISPGIGKVEDWLLSQGTHSAAAWADVAVLNPWNLYLTFGDEKVLRDSYESMKAWINFMQSHADGTIWNYKLQFGDWVALDAEEGSYFGATPNDLTCTAYYAYSTGVFAKIAQVLGKQEDYEIYHRLEKKIKEGFVRHFFDKTTKGMTVQTQTAHIIALYFGLTPEENKEQTVRELLDLLEKEGGHLVTGFVGTPYFTHALSQNGHLKEAYELLLKEDFPSWLYQVKQGATTVWEHWDGIKPDGTMWSPDMNSFNHYAYGSIGEWMYRVIIGLEQMETKPGYEEMILYPRIGGGLSYAKGSYQSVHGMINLAWTKDETQVLLEITIPVNTNAKICLEQAEMVIEGDGLEFVQEKDLLCAKAGSGTYCIRYC